MRTVIWAGLAVAGFFLMIASYERWMRLDPQAPWVSGFLCIGDGEPAEPVEAGKVVATRLRYLPLGPTAEAMLKGAAASLPGREAGLRARLRRKLIELPAAELAPLDDWLREGRLPESGKDELLGGQEAKLGERLTVAGRTLEVVGVLRPSVALFSDGLLIPAAPAAEALFAPDPDVRRVRIVGLTEAQFGDRKFHEQLGKAFPARSFVRLTPQVVTPPGGYYTYLVGQALLLAGGTGLLTGLYHAMARRIRWRWLADPLAEIVARPRLFWGVHIVYFGLYFLGTIAIHENRPLHALLMTSIQEALSGEGPLGVAGKAYMSGSIARAAAVTFVVNLFLGALLVITLPSLIVPGSGVLMAVLRGTLWGLLLGPADTSLALAMIPHSGTLLLEGEGYILAAFFGLLVPVILFGRGRPPKARADPDEWSVAEVVEEPASEPPLRRFGRALGLNLKAILLVALVLAVAACYEAVEVIRMAGL